MAWIRFPLVFKTRQQAEEFVAENAGTEDVVEIRMLQHPPLVIPGPTGDQWQQRSEFAIFYK